MSKQNKNETLSEYRIRRHKEYVVAKNKKKSYITLNHWFSLSKEERSSRQKKYNATRRSKHPNESKNGMKKWRELHGKAERERNYARRRENKRLAIEYLGGKCSRCGNLYHPDVYDFHHISGEKDKCVAKMLMRKFENIKPELDKCILLCANCHRIEHAQY